MMPPRHSVLCCARRPEEPVVVIRHGHNDFTESEVRLEQRSHWPNRSADLDVIDAPPEEPYRLDAPITAWRRRCEWAPAHGLPRVLSMLGSHHVQAGIDGPVDQPDIKDDDA
jgi:hypothetical protein